MAVKNKPVTNKPASGDKEKALETALAQIEKQFGKGTIMRLGENYKMNVEAISTGSLTLDLALGVGGLPRGRIVEIFGPESSGKTTVALHVVAEAQKMGGKAAFIDVEHALDPVYAKALGVDIDSLLVSQPDSGEDALEICEALVRSGAIDVVVLDSVAAMVPRAEIEGEMGDSHVGIQARLMSQALRKLTGIVSKSGTVCIFINQLREKIGVMYGQGISKDSEIVDVAVKLDIIQKSGAWFNYGETRLAQGRENTKNLIASNPELREEIENKIKDRADELTGISSAPKKNPIVSNSEEAGSQDDAQPKASIDIEVKGQIRN